MGAVAKLAISDLLAYESGTAIVRARLTEIEATRYWRRFQLLFVFLFLLLGLRAIRRRNARRDKGHQENCAAS